MKAIILFLTVSLTLQSGATGIREEPRTDFSKYMIVDSATVYVWDASISDWVPRQVQAYQYFEGRLISLQTRDYNSGSVLAVTVYNYNYSGKPDTITNFSLKNTIVPSTRSVNDYDSQGRVYSIRIQKRSGEVWSDDRLQNNYEYDLGDRPVAYESRYWRNGSWTLPTLNDLYYNDLGHLESHVATRPDGNIDYRIIYEYSPSGQQLQLYTQYPSGAKWSNWNLRTIQYNDCGTRASQVQYTGKGPDWIPSTKTEFFYTFNSDQYPGRKVPVCHNGHTIWVAVQAVPAHLRHGDCIGECREERTKQNIYLKEPPFIIFPNPARERITLRFSNECSCDEKRIELLDYSGNFIKAYNVSGSSDLIIERGGLKAGRYFVRISGAEKSYSVAVVFK